MLRGASVFLMLAGFFLSSYSHDSADDKDKHIVWLEQVKQEAHDIVWIDHDFTFSELQVLLNYTCLAFALQYVERAMHKESAFIMSSAVYAHAHHDEMAEKPELLRMVERSISRFRNYMQAKKIISETFFNLDSTLQLPGNEHLARTMKAMAEHATRLIRLFCLCKEEAIGEQLEQANESLKKSAHYTAALAGTYRGLLEKVQETGELLGCPNRVYMIDVLEKYATSLSLENTINPVLKGYAAVWQETMNVQEFGALAFYIYYTVVYDGMKARQCDALYFKPLFEDNCVVSVDETSGMLTTPVNDKNNKFFMGE